MPDSTDSLNTDTGNAAGGVDRTLNNAATAASNIVDRLAESAHRAIDRLAQGAGPAVERMRSVASSTVDDMGRKVDDLGATKEEWMDSARTSVQGNPMAAVGIAFAVGYLIARLSR
jgi:ElaB/YqjD/DUF883 family membrane-anchored ribosome-binding protein